MINNRLGAIFSEINNPPQNYATTILESLASLETTRNIFLNQNFPYMNQTLITNEFRNIINNVYSSENPISAMNLINYLNKYALNHNQDLNQCNNPYTFLYYFLSMLEEEYNNAFQIDNNLNQEFPSIENASNYFKQIYDTPNISIISKNYCFSLVMTNFCNACKTTKSKPMIKKTIDLNIDSYLQMNNSGSLSLNECLNYYFNPKQIQSNCQNCNNSKPFQARVILKSGPVLIINLMRNNYTGVRDPNFTISYNLDLSQYKKDKNEGNNNYRLKSCLSYSNFGFFTDCYIKSDNFNGEWFRYMNKQAIINRDTLFGFQPVLLFYESIDNQNNNNNINNMNININQNMNYNEQINQQNLNMNNINIQNNQNIIMNENNENILDIICNFPLNYNEVFGEQISNFDFNLDINSNIINSPQSNLQMDNNFNNYQNQNNNNFGNVSSQQQNQYNDINQNNIVNMDNNNINNQNLNNNNFEPNLNLLHHYNDEDEKGETDLENINNDSNEISNNPFFNANQILEKNQNSNFLNNNFNMDINMQSNLNQNMNQSENLNNDINQNININANPNLNNLNSNQNDNNNILVQNNSSNENQNDFSDQNQNLQNNMSNNNFNNEIKNDIQQNLNMNINSEKNNQMQPNFQQNNFMPKNNISNDMSNSMNSQEDKKEIPQMSSLSFPQEEMKNDIKSQINDSPQLIPNSNIEIQNKDVNEISQNIMNPIDMNINSNQNNFNPNLQINIPHNISNEINEIKNEESNQINKELPKLENKIESIKIGQKIELNKPPESQPEIKINIKEKEKLFAGGIKLNHPQENPLPKKKLNKDIIPKIGPEKQESKPMNFGEGKPNKFKDFKAMLEKKGGMFGAPRPSAQMMGMPHGFAGMMNKKDQNNQGPIFEENKDLVQKLDVIKVQKKKKKAKIIFDDES